MQKTIDAWAENGIKMELPEGTIASGWLANDQPAAEDWNLIQFDRDTQQIEDAAARAVREYGINPAVIQGNDGNKIPIYRPYPFVGSHRLWDPECSYNAPEPPNPELSAKIYGVSCGWDPVLNMPVIALAYNHVGSIPEDGSIDMDFVHCWDYDNQPVTKTTRSLSFGFSVLPITDGSFPVLICDGNLYVVVQSLVGAVCTVLRFSLSTWTGSPDAVLSTADFVNLGATYCTELVELVNGYIGFFAQNNSSGGVYFCRANKSLTTFEWSTEPLTGVTPLGNICRTDGETIFATGLSAALTPQVVCAKSTYPTVTPTLFTSGSGASDEKIVDFFPLRPGTNISTPTTSVACLMYKSVAPYGPFIRVVDFADTTPSFARYFYLNGSDMIFDWTKPGCFVALGNRAFVVLNRLHDLTTPYTQLVKIDPTYFLTDDGEAPVCSPSNTGRFVGSPLTGGYYDRKLGVRAVHDGRAVWVVDMHAPTVRRVVAPGV